MPKRVLVADNNAAFASQLVKMLEKKGIEVLLRPDSISATATLTKTPPDLVLMELDIPGLGKNLYRACRADAKLRSLPIIVLAKPDSHPAIWESLDAPPHHRTLVLRRGLNLKLLLPVIEQILALV